MRKLMNAAVALTFLIGAVPAQSKEVPRERQLELMAIMLLHQLNCNTKLSSKPYALMISKAAEFGDEIEAAQDRVKRTMIREIGLGPWCRMVTEAVIRPFEGLGHE